MKHLIKFLVAILAIIFLANNTFAATTNGTANARVVTALAVTAGNTLEFGSLAAGATSGTITQAGVVTGGVTAVAGGTTRRAGTFNVTGEPVNGTPYTFTLPATATITDGASHNMTVTLSFASGSSSRTLSAGGSDTVTINGSLAVAASQTAGNYTGTYSITVAY